MISHINPALTIIQLTTKWHPVHISSIVNSGGTYSV